MWKTKIAYTKIQNKQMENVFELCAISERSIKIKTKQNKTKTQVKQAENSGEVGVYVRACYA